jgi:trans-aconitate methyltransferase
VEQRQLVDLIRPAVAGAGSGGAWADLGAGDGNFALALRTLLPGATLTAVDQDASALDRLARRLPDAEVLRADFRRPLTLSGLDGVLMANALHFVRDKRPVLELVYGYLRPGGRLVVVEYGADRGNPWVPHPFSFPTWQRMAAAAGFTDVREAGSLPSRFLGSMYCAWCLKPAAQDLG